MKKSKHILAILVMASCLALGLSGCGTSDREDVVNIAVTGPMDVMEGEFKNGIEMALQEINKGYIEGTTVKVNYYDDKQDLTTGVKLAQKVVEQKDQYSAVIGHWNASINLAAAPIYQQAKLLAISPMVSAVELTDPAKEYIFRNVPTDADESTRMAKYARTKRYNRIAICYAETDYGKGLAKQFEKACDEEQLDVVDVHGMFSDQYDFGNQYEKWKALGVEAIFIADALPNAGTLIKQIRGQSKTLPILSGGGFSFNDVAELVGKKNSNHIAFVALYNSNDDFSHMRTFNKKYKKRYRKKPESFLASKGYETLYLLADAIKATGSKDSETITAYLHKMDTWTGVLDDYKFKANGDPDGIQLYVVTVSKGKYKYSL